MARPLRVQFPGAYYHALNRGLERRQVFLGEDDHRRWLDLLEDAHTRWQIRVFAYCCMPNHYHLLLQTPRGNLDRVMRHLDGLYTQGFNRSHGRDGPLFRGRYKAILVDADAYLLQLVRYIHLNPIAAGLVKEPGAYPWSSHRLYQSGKGLPWLACDEVLAHFKDTHAFERYVADGNDPRLAEFYGRQRWSPFLGGEEFVRQALLRSRRSPETPRAQMTPRFPTVASVAEAVAAALGVDPAELARSRRGQRNPARTLTIYVASRIAGLSHREIRDYFQIGTDSTVAQACRRAAVLLEREPHVAQQLRRAGVPIPDPRGVKS